jgi:nucleoside 2-deoxyribosyltransferase
MKEKLISGRIYIPGKKSLYLAHPFEMRKEVRAWEMGFEERTGIRLQNPFYDAEGREDIKLFDEGLLEPRTIEKVSGGLNIVERDLRQIEQADGVVAFMEPHKLSCGTPMEFFYNSRILQKETYVITSSLQGHPWIKGLAKEIFKTKEEFEKYALHNIRG